MLGNFILVFLGVLLLCKAKRKRRPKSSDAKPLRVGMMLSWI